MVAHLDRRSLFKHGGAAALVLGFSLDPRRAEASAAGGLGAYLRIESSGQIVLNLPKTEMGQGVYTAIATLLAEELEAPVAAIAVRLPDADADAFGPVSQATGGSTSIRDVWLPVRTAGAAARMMLVEAAALRWSVPITTCTAEGGEVRHAPSGRRLGYGALAEAAGRLAIPKQPKLKPSEAFRQIGRFQSRLDGPDKVRGRACYSIDVDLPGMKVAAFAGCPTVGGQLDRCNEAAAMAKPGVRQIVRLRDGLAVVGDHTWAAMQGLQAAAPQWSLGANAGLDQAEIVSQLRRAVETRGVTAGGEGEPDALLAGSPRRIEARYEQPFLAHVALEPLACVAHVKADSCEVWVGTQDPGAGRAAAARVAGLPLAKVKLHNLLMGGGFGRRLEVDMIEHAVAIAKSTPWPVKVVWSREEDIAQDYFRPYYVDQIAAVLAPDGRPAAWRHRISGASIVARLYPSAFNGVDVDAVEGAVETPYAIPHRRVEFARQESAIRTGWWRGVGPLRSTFVVESFIDELAAAAGTDPMAYRLSLIRDPRARAVLEDASRACNWTGPATEGVSRGVSLLHAWGAYMAQVVEVKLNADGAPVVRRVVASLDCGQVISPDGVRAQVEGGVIFGLSAALFGEITIAGGRPEQSNFHDYRVMRMREAPTIEVRLMASTAEPGGVGEAPTAGVAPALANAIFAATGKRVRRLPVLSALAEA